MLHSLSQYLHHFGQTEAQAVAQLEGLPVKVVQQLEAFASLLEVLVQAQVLKVLVRAQVLKFLACIQAAEAGALGS